MRKCKIENLYSICIISCCLAYYVIQCMRGEPAGAVSLICTYHCLVTVVMGYVIRKEVNSCEKVHVLKCNCGIGKIYVSADCISKIEDDEAICPNCGKNMEVSRVLASFKEEV